MSNVKYWIILCVSMDIKRMLNEHIRIMVDVLNENDGIPYCWFPLEYGYA